VNEVERSAFVQGGVSERDRFIAKQRKIGRRENGMESTMLRRNRWEVRDGQDRHSPEA